MSPRVWLWISRGHRLGMARAALGVAIVVALCFGGLALLDGLGRALEAELASAGGELRVKAPSLSLGGIDLSGGVLPGKAMDEAALRKLAEIAGVDDVQPEAWARVPLVFSGGFAGERLQSEGAMLGVVAAGVDNPRRWAWSPGQPVPVLAPRALLAVYNGSFAPTNGLPRLTDSALEGLDFQIVAGRSLYGRDAGPRVALDAVVIGTTRYGGALAAIVPLDVVRWIEAEAGLPDPGQPQSARLVLAPDAIVEDVDREIRALGWAVERGDGALEKLGALLRSVTLGLSAAAVLLTLATLLGVAQLQAALIRARAEEIRVLRALGLGAWGLGLSLGVEIFLGVGLASSLGVLAGSGLASVGAERVSEIVSGWIGLPVGITVGLPWTAWAAALLGPALGAVVLASPAVVGVVWRGFRGPG